MLPETLAESYTPQISFGHPVKEPSGQGAPAGAGLLGASLALTPSERQTPGPNGAKDYPELPDNLVNLFPRFSICPQKPGMDLLGKSGLCSCTEEGSGTEIIDKEAVFRFESGAFKLGLKAMWDKPPGNIIPGDEHRQWPLLTSDHPKGTRDKDAEKKPLKTEANMDVMPPHPTCRHQRLGEAEKEFPLETFCRNSVLSIYWIQTSGSKICETISYCCFKSLCLW